MKSNWHWDAGALGHCGTVKGTTPYAIWEEVEVDCIPWLTLGAVHGMMWDVGGATADMVNTGGGYGCIQSGQCQKLQTHPNAGV